MLQISFEVAPVGGLFYCFEVRSLNSREPLVMPALSHPQKITFGEMRSAGVRGLLIYCSDYKCSHSIAISADQWPDHVRLSDLEPRLVCKACDKYGADVRPDFATGKKPAYLG